MNTDLFVTFHGSDPPDIELITGRDDWTIYVQDASESAPADLGSLTTQSDADFTVSILGPGGSAGAVNVGSIVLTPSGDHYSSLGFCVQPDSYISGNLTGDITLQADSGGNGGILNLVLDGDVGPDSTITAPYACFLAVGPNAIGEFVGIMAGTLNLPNSVPAQGGGVIMGTLTGTIDLGGGTLGRYLVLYHGGSGDIVDGGTIADGGALFLCYDCQFSSFSGTAHVGQVEAGGRVGLGGGFFGAGALEGSLTIDGDMDGLIQFPKADLLDGGEIIIGGNLGGLMLIQQVEDLGGNVGGEIRIGGDVLSLVEDATSIVIEGSLTGVGRLKIDGSLFDGGDGQEIVIGGEIEEGAAVTVDYNGWHDGDDWDPLASIVVGVNEYNENTPSARVWEVQPCKGDMNNDGVLDDFDIDPFVLALISASGYAEAFPGLEGSRVYHGDCNCADGLNSFDIDPFVDLLVAECCTTDCTPCESFRSVSAPTAEAIAARLSSNVASERFSTLVAIVEDLAFNENSPNPERWADVLNYLGE